MWAVYVVSMALCRGDYHNSGISDSHETADMAGVDIRSHF